MIASVGAWMSARAGLRPGRHRGMHYNATHQWMTPSKSGEQSQAGSCCQSTLASDGLGVSIVGCNDRASQRSGQPVPNFVRFTFLHLDAAHDFYPDWDLAADTSVAVLHTEAGRDPHDKNLHDLVGELSTRSDDFRRRWDSRNVRTHGAGTKQFHHRDVGDLQLAYESVDMLSEPGLTLTLYAAEPGSPAAHALDLLASWTSPTVTPSPATTS